MKVDETVKRETLYVLSCVLALSVVMELIFLVSGHWDYTVLLGNLLSASVAVLNFFLMGITVQAAVKLDEKEARDKMKTSMTLRTMLLFAAIAIGVAAPCFNIIAAVVPFFFVRIAVALRQFILKDTSRGGK